MGSHDFPARGLGVSLLLLPLLVVALEILILPLECQAYSGPSRQQSLPKSVEFKEKDRIDFWYRRNIILLPALAWIPTPAQAILGPSAALATRDVDVGGGLDLLSKPRLSEKDVIYPLSMEGLWKCHRVVTQVEGDRFQAESAWKALGGGGDLQRNQMETYATRFAKSEIKVGTTGGVVVDRGFEMTDRAQKPNISWKADEPDVLEYDKFRITVVVRSVEPPNDQGFGFNEIYRIDDGLVTRAVQVKRRYRRAFDADGNRVVEGLEIMKTFRVLDGVAGTEMPTSTTKSQLQLTRS